MTRFEKRKIKSNLYKHGNAMMYVIIFAMASIITIAAALNRTNDIAYIDESQMAFSTTESVAIKNEDSNKVASTETGAEVTSEETTVAETENVQTTESVETTTPQTTDAETEQTAGTKVKITADTLKVRAEASADAEMLGMVDMDEVFEVISRNGDWIEINYNGSKGYINAEFTEITE